MAAKAFEGNNLSEEIKEQLVKAAMAVTPIDDEVIYKSSDKFCVKFSEIRITRIGDDEFIMKIKNGSLILFEFKLKFNNSIGSENIIYGLRGMFNVIIGEQK